MAEEAQAQELPEVEITMPEGYSEDNSESDLEVPEEIQNEVDEVQDETDVTDEVEDESDEPQYSDIELEAIKAGWNPEGVQGKRSLTAEEYLDRAPLYDRMHSQDKKIKKLMEANEALVKQFDGITERVRENTLKELKAKRLEAIREGDEETVQQYDDQIDEIRKEQIESKPVETQEQVGYSDEEQAELNDYEVNSEWGKDPDMQKIAYTFASEFMQEQSEVTGKLPDPKDVISYLEQKMEKLLPKKSAPKPRQAVEKSSRKPVQTKKGFGMKDLKSDADRRAAQVIIETGVPADQYFATLEKSGYFN